MTIEVLGWKFVDKQDANSYMALIDNAFGFPNDQTLSYTMYVIGSLNDEVIYYLLDDKSLYSFLGEPYLFNIYYPL
jgi:hypothetical protein